MNKIGLCFLGKSLLLALLIAIPANSYESMLSPSSTCGTHLNYSELKVGSELELSAGCAAGAPIVVEYHLPLDVKVVSLTGDGAPAIEQKGGEYILRWEIPADTHGQFALHFKIQTPGFYKFYGTVNLGNVDPEWLDAYMKKEVDRIPSYAGTDKRTKLLRQQYLAHPEEVVKGFQGRVRTYGMDVPIYYVSVLKDSGRLETWDFSSVGNRTRHWLRASLGYSGDNLTLVILALLLALAIMIACVAAGVFCIKDFHKAPSFPRMLLLLVGLFLTLVPIWYLLIVLKKYFPFLFSHMQ